MWIELADHPFDRPLQKARAIDGIDVLVLDEGENASELPDHRVRAAILWRGGCYPNCKSRENLATKPAGKGEGPKNECLSFHNKRVAGREKALLPSGCSFAPTWRSLLAIGDKEPKPATASDSKTDKRKQSLYFPESMLQEIKEEAARLDRSLSWVVQRAWKISRLEIKKLPSVNDVEDEDGDQE